MALTSKQLVESGAHFGENKKKWNPKMKEYIYTERKGFHIIDLQKASKMSEDLYNEVKAVAETGDVLFVGTKRQASAIIERVATDVEMPFVANRWLGGMLTNLKTIQVRIKKLEELEALFASEDINYYTKKEQMLMTKEMEKLTRFLGGIRNMNVVPKAIFVVDSEKEKNAILEAKKLGIKVFGIADTNSNPEDFDCFIPANDDAIKAIDLILTNMGEAVAEGTAARQ
ncbi:30S ribosomal protein S2 [Mollicutes bacterium LVI A0078]|nr:30S ribosomal protein S2 [Mollicutes bacterium LVI A0075]WOO90971.1 30S ribosomal protein S2 [Mollicutes bacterium LVI A0078]